MKDKSGSLPSVDLAVRLSSALADVLAKDVLLASSPNWSSCNSMLFCFLPARGVEGWDEVCEDVSAAALSPVSPSFRSSESIQVERLTTSRSLRTSSWMEVSCLLWDWGLRSRPRRSASKVNEASGEYKSACTCMIVHSWYNLRLMTLYLPSTTGGLVLHSSNDILTLLLYTLTHSFYYSTYFY